MTYLKYKVNKIFAHVDWTLFFILLLSILSPLITRLVRIILISLFASTQDFSISQSWVVINLFYEAIQLLAILPAYAFINKGIKNGKEQKQKTILAILFAGVLNFILFIIVAIVGIALTKDFLDLNEGYKFTTIYFYIMIISFSMGITLFSQVLIAYTVLTKNKKTAAVFGGLQLIVAVGIDLLFLTPLIFDEINLWIIAASSFLSASLFLIIQTLFVYFEEPKEWNFAIANLNFKKWKSDFKIYWKNGSWLFLEAVAWNLIWYFAIINLYLNVDTANGYEVWLAFSLTDSLFWIFLFLPMKAVNMIVAERLSISTSHKQNHEIIIGGLGLSVLVLLSWIVIIPLIIWGLYPLIIQEDVVLNYLVLFSLIAVPFFAFQLPSKVLYTYFAATEQGKKAFYGSLIGASIFWGPIILYQLLGYGLTDNNYWWGIIAYGIGIVGIFILYSIIYYIHHKKLKNENKESFNENENYSDEKGFFQILEDELPL